MELGDNQQSAIYRGSPDLRAAMRIRKHFRDSSGLKCIKQRLNEMQERKRMLHANQSLNKLFHDVGFCPCYRAYDFS